MGKPTCDPASLPRLELAKLRISDETAAVDACLNAARLSAQTLQVSRVGIWMFDKDKTRLRCVGLHEREPSRSPPIMELSANDFPTYVGALAQRRWIAADDACTDPVTSELAESYLVPQGIVSMLDAPIFRGEDALGIICHEETTRRPWSGHDRAFAGTMADIIALIFEQRDHLRSERIRRTLEVERRHAVQLELLGHLSLSVAHDLNNILATLQLLATPLARGEEVRAATTGNAILEAIHMASGLTKELLAVGKKPATSESASTDLGATVDAFGNVLRAVVRGRATLTIAVPDEALVVCVSANQIQQLLLNLVVNARDASTNDGLIEITVERCEREGKPHAVLRVTDDGTGIEPSVLDRLGEPFFTTKTSGTGWGLTIIREIAEAAGGTVHVASSPGEGATFDVWLPLV